MTQPSADSVPSPARRRFLEAGARTLLLGGMAAYLAHQGWRARRLEGDPSCIRLHTCAVCVELSSGCALPKAESFRAARAGERRREGGPPPGSRPS